MTFGDAGLIVITDTCNPTSAGPRRRRWRIRQVAMVLVLISALALTTVGCGCATALLPGMLVAQGSELAIKEDTGGFVRSVRWPLGYGVRADDDRLVLTDILGNVKAREGDHVRLPGGETSANGPWGVCGEIEVG